MEQNILKTISQMREVKEEITELLKNGDDIETIKNYFEIK